MLAALAAGNEFEAVYCDVERVAEPRVALVTDASRQRGVRVDLLARGVMDKVADSVTPQGVLAAVRFSPRTLDFVEPHGVVVGLVDVRDPGNAGAVVRTAEAAGATAVIFVGECVDPYNPKTMRAAAGAISRFPVVVEPELPAAIAWFRKSGGTVLATVVSGGSPFRETDLRSALILFGNEGEGLTTATRAQCDGEIAIAMRGEVESLNVAVAAGVILFEAVAQAASTPLE